MGDAPVEEKGKDGEREEDQMGRGGMDPRRAGIKKRGFKNKVC